MQRTKGINNILKKRHRNIAHLWTDKQVLRFFRKNFNRKHYKNLRSIYIALCEIDSDFGENKEIKGFTKTVATYAGMGEDTVRKYLRAIQKANLIDYWQVHDKKGQQYGHTILEMYKWENTKEKTYQELIIMVLDSRPRENPSPGKPVPGKTDPIKNTNKLVYTNKNSKESLNHSWGKQKKYPIKSQAIHLTKFFFDKIVKAKLDIPKIDENDFWSGQNYFQELLKNNNLPKERIEAAINWLSNNYDEPYCPQIISALDFKQRFSKIEQAMSRGTKQILSPQSNRLNDYDSRFKEIHSERLNT